MLEFIYAQLFQMLTPLPELAGWSIVDGEPDVSLPYLSLAECGVAFDMPGKGNLQQRATTASVELLFVSRKDGGSEIRSAMDGVIRVLHRTRTAELNFLVDSANVDVRVVDGTPQRRGRMVVRITGWEAYS